MKKFIQFTLTPLNFIKRFLQLLNPFLLIISFSNLLVLNLANASQVPNRFASGDKLGLYYTIADLFCYIQDHVNQKNICDAIESKGSRDNINLIKNKQAEFGIIQMDHLYDDYLNNPDTKIRSIIRVYPETFTLIVKKNSDIWSIKDLQKIKKLGIGQSGGAKSLLTKLMEEVEVDYNKITFDSNYTSTNMPDAICEDKIDAAAFMIAHPNAMLQEIAKECEVRLIPVSESLANRIMDKYKFYHKDVIRDNLYPGIIMPVFSLSTYAVIAGLDNNNEKQVFDFVKNVANNLKYLRKSHEALNELEVDNFLPSEDVGMPLHKGTRLFFDKMEKSR
ncbi:MAG: TAXI family TRAP transporter solute-binding subunit [Sphingobacteriia bacterium]|nr:TAXI family TRAP transporter solute-binding subunit [Sphingobacteriia bacterium]